jgi:hypothetical protein
MTTTLFDRGRFSSMPCRPFQGRGDGLGGHFKDPNAVERWSVQASRGSDPVHGGQARRVGAAVIAHQVSRFEADTGSGTVRRFQEYQEEGATKAAA